MKPTSIITLQVYDGTTGWYDYTEGILDINIVRGAQQYSGPFTQPDVGELTLKSRNENLDPYNNPLVKYGAQIRIAADSVRIFTGRIEGIDIDYRPLEESNIITIKAIDLIGTLNKHILSESFISAQSNWTMAELYNSLSSTDEIEFFQGDIYSSVGTANANAPISLGTTALNALQDRAKTNLGFMFANTSNGIEYWRHTKDDPANPGIVAPSKITFAYDGTGYSYRKIFVSDGFDRIVNQLEINGTGIDGDTTQIVSAIGGAIDVWGKATASVNLSNSDNVTLQSIANTVLQEMADPTRDIYEITWDSTLNPSAARNIDILDNIRIKHKISETLTIERKYQVIGIKHTINFYDWETTYILRNWAWSSTVTPNPIINITPESGPITTNFTFSYTVPNPAEVASVLWQLDDGFTSTLASPIQQYVNSGTKTITLIVTTIYGYTKEVTVELEVADGPPIAEYTYTANEYNVYQFTYTGTTANSYLWDFGDGTTSTEPNPTKYYTSTGTRLVKVTATNSFGSDSEQKPIPITGITNVPVRYIRYRFIAVGNTSPTVHLSTSARWFIQSHVNSISEGKIRDVAVIDYDEHSGWITGAWTKDTYGRTTRAFAPAIIEETYNNTYQQRMYVGRYFPADDPNHPSLYYVIDLGKEYFDIDNINFEKGQETTIPGTIRVDVSQDGVTWYFAREITPNSSSSSTCAFNNIANTPLPAKFSLPIADPMAELTPIRYLKVKTNKRLPLTLRWFAMNEFIPVTGDGVVDKGDYASGDRYRVDSLIGAGGIATGKLVGASIEYAQESVGPVDAVTYVNGGSDTVNGTYFPPSYNLPNMNTLSLQTRISASSQNPKAFIYDFGVPLKKITGFYWDKRRGTYWDENEAEYTADNTMTIELLVSEDKINWKSLGTFPASARPNDGDNGTSRAILIRVNPTNYSGTDYYYPISDDSTFTVYDLGPGEASGLPVLR